MKTFINNTIPNHFGSADKNPRKSSINVLLVNDEENILHAITRELRKQPLNIITSLNGVDACKVLVKQKIDILITDLKMPAMDSEALLDVIKKQHPHIICILLTGFDESDFVKRAINENKIAYFMNKPWSKDELIYAVQKARNNILYKRSKRLEAIKHQERQQKLDDINKRLSAACRQQLTTLKASLKKLEHQNDEIDQTLSRLIEISPNIDASFCKQISLSCTRFGEKISLNTSDINTLRLSGMLCEIGLLSTNKNWLVLQQQNTNNYQSNAYTRQVLCADLILRSLHGFDDIHSTIIHQHESYKAFKNPRKNIPYTSLVLHIVRDIWALKLGRITGDRENDGTIANYLKRYSGILYCPKLVRVAIANPSLFVPYQGDIDTPCKDIKRNIGYNLDIDVCEKEIN